MSQQPPYNPYNWKMILVSQTAMLAMSAVLSFYPEYFLPFYILYIVIIMGVSMYIAQKSNPLLSERKYFQEIVKAPTLFEERRALDLAMRDEEYQAMFREYTSKTMRSLGIMFLYMILLIAFYYLAFDKLVTQYQGMQRFLIYVGYFEALFLFNFFVYRRLVQFRMMEVVAPNSYKVTTKGIASTDVTGIVLHFRHFVGAKITVNADKSYVEVDSSTSKLPFRVRLYSNDLQRLKEAIEKLQRLAKEQEGKT
ncbi:MAG: DUF2208 family protein [Thermoprotei archaeon]